MMDYQSYEQIWDLDNISYLFWRAWLGEKYRAHDFLVGIDGSQFQMYLGKGERKKLSQMGWRLLESELQAFEFTCGELAENAKLFFEDVDLGKLTNDELAAKFGDLTSFMQKLSDTYFYTESFCYDSVEEQLVGESALELKVHKMQELKYSMRELINRFIWGKSSLFDQHVNAISGRLEREVNSYNHTELIALLQGKTLSIPDRHPVVLGKFSAWRDVVGDEAINILSKLSPVIIPDATELKGSIASKGVHIGKVIVIPFDFHFDVDSQTKKMNRGDVLVAVSTGPEMMDACELAGAIVTEEGGVCSHASIVSREFGIPCIIGVVGATKVINDGDKIEVDADNGLVKVIQRNENKDN